VSQDATDNDTFLIITFQGPEWLRRTCASSLRSSSIMQRSVTLISLRLVGQKAIPKLIRPLYSTTRHPRDNSSSTRDEKIFSVEGIRPKRQTTQFDSDKSSNMADWMSWLSQNINYGTVLDDMRQDKEMRTLRTEQA